jgi:hypothetical protein
MPRQPLSKERLFELLNNQYRYGGMAEFQTKGFTEEEEGREIKHMFQDVWDAGYEHVHTLRIVPKDGREPYYVHVDSLNGEQSVS